MAVGLLFSGQGAQTVGMGKSLYETFPVAKAIYDEAADTLGFNIRQISFEGPEATLTETRYCQPALFVQGYAIYKVLQDLGKLENLNSATGLSLGELTALACADVFDLKTGLHLVYERGRLMQEACDQTSGGMASLIGGSRELAETLATKHDLDISNYNCPGQIVVAGPIERVEQAAAEAKGAGFKMGIMLKVAGAYHSRLMQSASDAFKEILAPVEFSSPKISVFTNVTGKEVTEPQEIKDALVKQIVSAVRFEECLQNAASQGVEHFYECGSGAVLSGLARRTDKSIKVIQAAEAEHINSL